MEFIFPLFNIIPLAIIAAVIYAIVQARRRRRGGLEPADRGIGSVRRLYFYSVSFVALMMAGNGLVQMVQYVLEALFGGDVISPSDSRLAVGAALAIVGLPLWLFHWRMVARYVEQMPDETRSLIRKSYVYLVLAVSVGLTIFASVDLLRWALRVESFGGYPLAAAIIWPAVWAFHWRLESSEGQPTWETLGIRRFYLYLASIAGLAMLAVGLGRAVGFVLVEGYESSFSASLLLPADTGLWRPATRSALALAMAGGAVWALHWLYAARGDLGSALRQVYLYVFAVIGGMVTILISLGFIITGVLVWLLGGPTVDPAETHFRFLPWAIVSLSVGAAIWAYHWTLVRREAEVSPEESEGARRTYAYIMSALGLGAVAVAVGTLVNAAIGVIAESSRPLLAGEELWREPIAVGIALAVLGLPIWGYYWSSIQRRVGAEAGDEAGSLPRRVFIFAALGIGMLALLGSVSALVFFFVRDLLEDGVSRETLRDARVAIDVVAAVAIFLPYHWLVYRKDRAVEEEAPEAVERSRRKEVAALVNGDSDAFVQRIEAALGYRIDVLRWADPEASLPQLAEDDWPELARRISDAPGESVLLVPNGTTVRVLSYS